MKIYFVFVIGFVCYQMANYIGDLVRQAEVLSLKIGVVQTAYANGASTDYINNVAVSCHKFLQKNYFTKICFSCLKCCLVLADLFIKWILNHLIFGRQYRSSHYKCMVSNVLYLSEFWVFCFFLCATASAWASICQSLYFWFHGHFDPEYKSQWCNLYLEECCFVYDCDFERCFSFPYAGGSCCLCANRRQALTSQGTGFRCWCLLWSKWSWNSQ